MGFITVGQGYKRRQVRPATLYHRAGPRRKHNSTNNTISSQAHRDHRIQQPVQNTPHKSVNFSDLPQEILLQIFSRTGFGSSNSLHLTCKYFNNLFSPSQNPWLLKMMAEMNSLVDLNGNFITSSETWHGKFTSKINSVSQVLRQRYKIGQHFKLPMSVIEHKDAFNLAIMRLYCVDTEEMKAFRQLGHNLVCDESTISEQLRLREHYLEWRFLVLEHFIRKAQEDEESEEPLSAEKLLLDAEDMASCVKLRDTYDLKSFVPAVKSDRISEGMFGPLCVKLIQKILCLNEFFNVEFERPIRFVARVLTSQIQIGADLVESLLSLINQDNVSSNELISILTAFRNCQLMLREISLEQRSSHYLQPLVERLYGIVRTCLTSYHESSSEDRHRDGAMWELLSQIQIPELIDHVISLGGVPTYDLL